jgi:hypothetical protein
MLAASASRLCKSKSTPRAATIVKMIPISHQICRDSRVRQLSLPLLLQCDQVKDSFRRLTGQCQMLGLEDQPGKRRRMVTVPDFPRQRSSITILSRSDREV